MTGSIGDKMGRNFLLSEYKVDCFEEWNERLCSNDKQWIQSIIDEIQDKTNKMRAINYNYM